MVTISFIGDISLNDAYTGLFREGAEPFQDLEGILTDADLVAGNLECLSAGTGGENLQKKPRLKTGTETLGYLKKINLGLACLANNHVYDNLEDGFRKTTNFLNQNNINFIGASLENSQEDPPANQGDPSLAKSPSGSVLKLGIKGIRFAFFNYVATDTNPGIPRNASVHLSILDRQQVIDDLAAAGEEDFRILILHWGGKYENSYYPGPQQMKMAREFIKGGADLIIGHHPHTLQPVLRYNGKSVFFSLGNFCFAENIRFNKDHYHTDLVPFRLDQLRTIRDQSILRRFKIRQQYFKLIRFSRLFWVIYYFGFKYLRPVAWEMRRPDPDKSLLKRLSGLNPEKIRQLFR
jgi:poly-gamma-glutamate synthesis protein (capsule biosynthesis protein)